jgi:taurine dioxygenase
MTAPDITIRPLTGAMGAEIFGIDLSQPIADATFGRIHRALLDHGAIFFRGQSITPAQQLTFAGRWGEIHFHPHMKTLPDHPGVMEILKQEDDTNVFGENWHTDQIFTATPARLTMLYAKEVPAVGGDTLFADLQGAYDALSDGMKQMIAGLRTVNVYQTDKVRPSAMKPTLGDEPPKQHEHPLVRQHPETGRQGLYFCHRGITRRLAGMTEEESRPLLEQLLTHATRPEFTCRFRWEVDSLALWDNRRVLHYPVNDYYGHRRLMHRITIQGDRTF